MSRTSRPRQGFLIVIAACSGTGKSTVCRQLLERDSQMRVSVSYTTRAPRGQEETGVHYHFVQPETFESMVEQGDFLEWARVHDYAYGTGRSATEEMLNQGLDVLLDIDVQGAFQIREDFGERTILVFLLPPDWKTLRERLEGRGTETEERILRRLQTAQKELMLAGEFEHLVVNDDLDLAVSEILAIRDAKTTQSRYNRSLLDALISQSKT